MNFKKLFSRINNQDDAAEKAEGGFIAGLIMAGWGLFKLMLNWISEKPLFEYETRTDHDFYYTMLVLIGFGLFLSWRVYAKQSYVSALLLLAILAFSTVFEFIMHPEVFMSIGVILSIIVRLWLFTILINSVRGCWYLSKREKSST